jgi:hypothetical protein
MQKASWFVLLGYEKKKRCTVNKLLKWRFATSNGKSVYIMEKCKY